MELKSESMPSVADLTPPQLDSFFFNSASFGNFIILDNYPVDYLQAGAAMWIAQKCEDNSAWEASFLRRQEALKDAQLFVIEFHVYNSRAHYQAQQALTIHETRHLFIDYLLGNKEWRERLNWTEIEI